MLMPRRCNDFESNPYAIVLIPEPMDYFAACAATSVCEVKCRNEFKAFDRQLAVEAAAHFSNQQSRTVQKTVESMLFNDIDEDTYTPMNIMAMVELSDCTSICGGIYVAEEEDKGAPENQDTCIAVAGLPSNSTVMVKKYCIPKAQVYAFSFLCPAARS